MPVPAVLAGRYRLRDLLGRGGMGDVYDAWDERLKRPVAVKVLRPEFADRIDVRTRFESEASTAATLNHPNVVSVYDSGEDLGVPFIVMERLPGRTLSDEIGAGPMAPGRVRTVLSDVLSAIDAAHAAGILHRDIKPGNVLFSSTGTVKVADFGIAKTADSAHTTTGEVLGTVAYLSPQRIEGTPATGGDDIYAVGVVGYEAITGRRPFTGDNILSMAREILQHQPEPIASVQSPADPALISVVERAMAPDPRARFPTAGSMAAALQAPPGPVRPTATTPFAAAAPGRPLPPSVAPATSASRRRPLLIAAMITAVVAALLVGGVVLASRDDTGTPATSPSSELSTTPTTPASAPPATAETTIDAPTNAPTTEDTAPVVIPGPTGPEQGNGNNGNGNGNGNGDEKKPKKDSDDKN